MKNTTKTPDLIPLQNFFAETLKEIFEETPDTQTMIANATGIPSPHLSQLKSGIRRCTPAHDLRLSKYFGIESGYFLRLQMSYDLEVAKRKSSGEIAKIKTRKLHPRVPA